MLRAGCDSLVELLPFQDHLGAAFNQIDEALDRPPEQIAALKGEHDLANGAGMVIRLKEPDKGLIAQLIRRTDETVVLRQYNRPGEIELRGLDIQIDVVVLRTTTT
jgi:hypothetical protein